MRYFLIFVSFSFLFSCSVQKRRYQKGFYFARAHHKQKATKPQVSPDITHKQAAEKPAESIVLQTPAQQAGASATLQAAKHQMKSLFLLTEDSCDVLLFKDGSEIKAKVLEVGQADIKYRRCDNQDGPTYVTRKADLFMIKYGNGTREIIKAEPQVPQQAPTYNTYQYKKPRLVTHPLAPIALVLGILSIIIPYMSVIFLSFSGTFPPFIFVLMVGSALLAVIVGRTAMNRIKEQPDVYKGKGLAIPGFIMGLVMLCIYLAILLIVLIALGI